MKKFIFDIKKLFVPEWRYHDSKNTFARYNCFQFLDIFIFYLVFKNGRKYNKKKVFLHW